MVLEKKKGCGGRIIQGSVTIGDMDTNVAYGDINRQWTTT